MNVYNTYKIHFIYRSIAEHSSDTLKCLNFFHRVINLWRPYKDNLERIILSQVSTTLFKNERESAFYNLAQECLQPSTYNIIKLQCFPSTLSFGETEATWKHVPLMKAPCHFPECIFFPFLKGRNWPKEQHGSEYKLSLQ